MDRESRPEVVFLSLYGYSEDIVGSGAGKPPSCDSVHTGSGVDE